MREIRLNNYPLPTVVDDEDFERLKQYQWTANIVEGKVQGVVRRGEEGHTVQMHRVILDAPSHLEGDHIDSNPLNNLRSNLRLATRAQQCQNRSKSAGCTSQFKGVRWDKDRNKWRGQIKVSNQLLHLGVFKPEDEIRAAMHYDIAALYFYGEFAKLNFPEHLDEYLNVIGQLKVCGKL